MREEHLLAERRDDGRAGHATAQLAGSDLDKANTSRLMDFLQRVDVEADEGLIL